VAVTAPLSDRCPAAAFPQERAETVGLHGEEVDFTDAVS